MFKFKIGAVIKLGGEMQLERNLLAFQQLLELGEFLKNLIFFVKISGGNHMVRDCELCRAAFVRLANHRHGFFPRG